MAPARELRRPLHAPAGSRTRPRPWAPGAAWPDISRESSGSLAARTVTPSGGRGTPRTGVSSTAGPAKQPRLLSARAQAQPHMGRSTPGGGPTAGRPLGTDPAEPATGAPRCSARGALVNAPQTCQQPLVWVSWRRHHLEHGLEGPAVQLLLYLVSVKVRGHQAEEVDVHVLQLAHPADDVGQAAGELRSKADGRGSNCPEVPGAHRPGQGRAEELGHVCSRLPFPQLLGGSPPLLPSSGWKGALPSRGGWAGLGGSRSPRQRSESTPLGALTWPGSPFGAGRRRSC